MLNWLKENAASARTKLAGEVSKFRNRDFMEAVTAACALIAYADGVVEASEKQKMIGFVRVSEELKVFETEEVIAAFNKSAEKFDFDLEIGKAEALKVIAKMAKKPDAGRLVIRVACAIGAADGNFDDREKAAARLICNELGLSPADFDL